VVEPDWFADGDFAWLDAAELETSGQVDVAGLETAEPEPQQATDEVEAVAEHDAIAEPEPTPADTPVEAEAAPAPPATPEPALEFETPADFESWRPPTASVPEVASEPEIADAPEPQAMSAAVAAQDVEEEVMWLGAEPEASQPVTDEPPVQGQAEVQAWPTADATPAVEVVRPPLAMTEEELSRLALDEGWDEAEVAAIRAMITPPPEPRVVLPGASELDEAMAALEAVPVRSDFGSDGSRQWTKPAPGRRRGPSHRRLGVRGGAASRASDCATATGGRHRRAAARRQRCRPAAPSGGPGRCRVSQAAASPPRLTGDAPRRGSSRLPDLGPRGEGWVVGQIVLIGLIVLAGRPGLGRPIPANPLAWLEIALGAAALVVAAWAVGRALVDLGRSLTPVPRPRSDGRLVTTGIYSHVRHPIYAGMILAGIGLGLDHPKPGRVRRCAAARRPAGCEGSSRGGVARGALPRL